MKQLLSVAAVLILSYQIAGAQCEVRRVLEANELFGISLERLARSLTSSTTVDGVSPDGSYAVLCNTAIHSYRLLNLQTGDVAVWPTDLDEGVSCYYLRWSPSGERVVCWARPHGGEAAFIAYGSPCGEVDICFRSDWQPVALLSDVDLLVMAPDYGQLALIEFRDDAPTLPLPLTLEQGGTPGCIDEVRHVRGEIFVDRCHVQVGSPMQVRDLCRLSVDRELGTVSLEVIGSYESVPTLFQRINPNPISGKWAVVEWDETNRVSHCRVIDHPEQSPDSGDLMFSRAGIVALAGWAPDGNALLFYAEGGDVSAPLGTLFEISSPSPAL